ncbi:MAG TPA: cysteine synthase A [Dehalococcoidia bacterium]|nr:cysteine synthase A [Dehalococcoidia bacterium]
MDWSARKKIADNILDTAGLTPMVRLRRVTQGVKPAILAKLEYFAPSGSLKDRILPDMVREAERRGELKPGMTIVEATTGNMGIATAMTGAALGYPVLIVMPEGMSEERKKAIRAYGAELLFTPGGESDVDLVLDKVRQLREENPGKYWEVGQFSNPDNVNAHYRRTAPEIWEQTGGQVDIFVAAQGSGGTISGVSRYLKEKNPKVLTFAVEPAECPTLSEGKWGSHLIEGIGDGFVPDNLDLSVIDGVVTTTSQEAIRMAQRLAREEGIFCGISSGCNVAACLKVARQYPEVATIVTVINDDGFRYLSTELCGEASSLQVPEREHPAREKDRMRLAERKLIIIR